MTRQYETVYIFDSALEDQVIADKLGKFHALLHAEGEITLQLNGMLSDLEEGLYEDDGDEDVDERLQPDDGEIETGEEIDED